MYARDRLANLGLLGAALVAWIAVVVFVTTRSPVGDVGRGDDRGRAHRDGLRPDDDAALLAGGLPAASPDRLSRRLAPGGARGVEVGLLVTFFVILRSQDAFSWPLAAFVAAMVVFVEISLSVER